MGVEGGVGVSVGVEVGLGVSVGVKVGVAVLVEVGVKVGKAVPVEVEVEAGVNEGVAVACKTWVDSPPEIPLIRMGRKSWSDSAAPWTAIGLPDSETRLHTSTKDSTT